MSPSSCRRHPCPSRRPAPRRSLAVASVLLAVVVVSSGCRSQADAKPPQVATVDPSRAASVAAQASSSGAASERPVIRPDMTSAESDRLYAVYQRCLSQHGFSKERLGAQLAAGTLTMNQFNQKSADAERACAQQQPEQWWEVAKDSDPNWPDELHAWVVCLDRHGIPASVSGGFLAFDNGLPSDSQEQVVTDCGTQAIGYKE